MSVINRLASQLDRNDEVPNQELAEEIVKSSNKEAVKELVDALSNKDKAIQNDSIKVLYEVGYQKPELIAPYSSNFIDLLTSRNNRIQWGAMTGLGTIADIKANEIFSRIDAVIRATEIGSVITQDWGIKCLAIVASKKEEYSQRIFPFLADFLKSCRPKDLPRHAENVVVAVNESNKTEFTSILESRIGSLKPAQEKRISKILKNLK